MAKPEERVTVDVDGRQLTLSNLSKVLYPEVGFSKAEVVDYYSRIAPVLLPHIQHRPMTFTRWPDGVEGKTFFEKNAPSHAPDWVRRATLPAPGSGKNRDTIDYVLVDDLPTLVWAANLAALELHVPQWRVATRGAVKGTPRDPDLLVLDLDPGPPADAAQCCRVALLLRERLVADGLVPFVKTSGSKGLQVYVPIKPTSAERTSAYAKALAEDLERVDPSLVVSRMARNLRPGKVLVDWSQNNGAKTTVAPYSMRARARPTVSTPITWDEVEACDGSGRATDLVFVTGDVLERVASFGDLMAPLHDTPAARRGSLGSRP